MFVEFVPLSLSFSEVVVKPCPEIDQDVYLISSDDDEEKEEQQERQPLSFVCQWGPKLARIDQHLDSHGAFFHLEISSVQANTSAFSVNNEGSISIRISL